MHKTIAGTTDNWGHMATLSLRRINPSWRRFGFLSVLGIGTIVATNPTLRPAMTVLWAMVLLLFRPKQPLVSVRDEILAWARQGFPAFSSTFALIGGTGSVPGSSSTRRTTRSSCIASEAPSGRCTRFAIS